jgi:hypothetical protein
MLDQGAPSIVTRISNESSAIWPKNVNFDILTVTLVVFRLRKASRAVGEEYEENLHRNIQNN